MVNGNVNYKLPGNTSLVSGLDGWIHPFLCWIMHWNMMIR